MLVCFDCSICCNNPFVYRLIWFSVWLYNMCWSFPEHQFISRVTDSFFSTLTICVSLKYVQFVNGSYNCPLVSSSQWISCSTFYQPLKLYRKLFLKFPIKLWNSAMRNSKKKKITILESNILLIWCSKVYLTQNVQSHL